MIRWKLSSIPFVSFVCAVEGRFADPRNQHGLIPVGGGVLAFVSPKASHRVATSPPRTAHKLTSWPSNPMGVEGLSLCLSSPSLIAYPRDHVVSPFLPSLPLPPCLFSSLFLRFASHRVKHPLPSRHASPFAVLGDLPPSLRGGSWGCRRRKQASAIKVIWP